MRSTKRAGSGSPRSRQLPASSTRPFEYRALFGGPLKPAVPLIIHGPKNGLTTPGLVDSGADTTLFPAPFAASLGIDLEADFQEASGSTAGGETVQYVYEPGLEVEIQAMGMRIPVVAALNPALPIVLLGRLDFFSHFRVLFDERAQVFTLERYE